MPSLKVPRTPLLTEGHLGSLGASTGKDPGHKLTSLLLPEPSGTFRQHTALPGSASLKPTAGNVRPPPPLEPSIVLASNEHVYPSPRPPTHTPFPANQLCLGLELGAIPPTGAEPLNLPLLRPSGTETERTASVSGSSTVQHGLSPSMAASACLHPPPPVSIPAPSTKERALFPPALGLPQFPSVSPARVLPFPA